jgi:hypothetical protein
MAANHRDPYAFENRSYFLFPFRVTDDDAFLACLTDGGWAEEDIAFETQYILHYASKMNDREDTRLLSFARAGGDLPLYTFDTEIRDGTVEAGTAVTGQTPKLSGLRTYVFRGGISFLEVSFDYGGMNLYEIAEFIFRMRSLRNDETKTYLAYPEGSIGMETAIRRVLPGFENCAELCFHNPSEIKKQAYVYTIVNAKNCGCDPLSPENRQRFRFLLSHGYRNRFYDPEDSENPYEMSIDISAHTLWSGSQEALVCLTDAPYGNQFAHLCTDYRFVYLLLLYQYLAAISYIEEFSRPNIKEEHGRSVHRNVVYLKTKYSFRVISDDRNFQSLYNGMYRVFEIDNLLADLEESNDQISDILEEKRQKHEQRFEWILGALSVLAVFSTLIDLSDYLDRFTNGELFHSIISLVTTLMILVIAVILILRKKN